MNNLPTRIKHARKSQNMTLKEVAELTGLSISYISDLEHGRAEPSLATVRKLREHLDIYFGNDKYELSFTELQLVEAWRNQDYPTILRMVASRILQPSRKEKWR